MYDILLISASQAYSLGPGYLDGGVIKIKALLGVCFPHWPVLLPFTDEAMN